MDDHRHPGDSPETLPHTHPAAPRPLREEKESGAAAQAAPARETSRARSLIGRAMLAATAALVVLALVLGAFYGTAVVFGVRGSVLSYGNMTDSSIDVTFEVNRKVGTAVVCDLAAVGEGMFDVGAIRVDVPAAEQRRSVAEVTIPTAQRPLAARVIGCYEAP